MSKASASQSIVDSVLHLPAAVFDEVGVSAAQLPSKVTGAALMSNGKPEVMYIGGEYCPFCAATRWPLVLALSRFGTFENLRTTASSPRERYPNTPTFTFHGAKYSSPYVEFVGREWQDVDGRALESIDRGEMAIFQRYSQQRSYPFVDFGNRWVVDRAPFLPTALSGESFEAAARQATDPTTELGREVLQEANAYTAVICDLTGGQPVSVCSAPGVMQYGALSTRR